MVRGSAYARQKKQYDKAIADFSKAIDLDPERPTHWADRGHAYALKGDMARAMIARTIRAHLDKELLLRPKGIKVLSLFFIDKVDNYRAYNAEGEALKGPYAVMFEQ